MSHNSRKRGRGGGIARHPLSKEGPGCGLSLLEQRVGRSTWAHGIPYSASSSSSSSSTLSNANIVSEIVRRRDMSGLVNFCHHKSISHARGTASFRGGRVSARRRCYFQLGGRKSILKISSVETHFEYRSNIDIILFPPSREKARAPLFFFLFRATKGAASVVVFIILNARAPSSRRFRRLPHQSFRLIGPRNLPLPTRITQIIVFVSRKRPPKKRRNVPINVTLSLSPLPDSSAQNRRTEREREERGFLHLWWRRAPVVESLLILPGSPVSIPFHDD